MHKYKSKQTTPTSYKYIYTISRPPEALTPTRLTSNKSCTTKMGRQQQNNSDHTVTIHSSIALLQERFRQLQRVKEMREERELLRFFSESERISPAATLENPSKKLFFHPELIIPPPVVSTPPPVQASFSIQPEPQNKYADHHFLAVDTPLLMSLWPTDRGIVRASNTFDDGDVDTSLHL